MTRTDRHTQPRLTLRASPAQLAAWHAAAEAAGVPLTALAATALDSFVASLRTATLRATKDARRVARMSEPCQRDRQCSLVDGHRGRCNWGAP